MCRKTEKSRQGITLKTEESCNIYNANHDKNVPKAIKCLNEISFAGFYRVFYRDTSPKVFRAERPSSPAPEASDDLAKVKFYAKIAKVKNAPASGVGWSALLCDFLAI